MASLTTKVLQHQIAKSGIDNLIFSPLSCEIVLALVLAGTQSNTQKVLQELLQVGNIEDYIEKITKKIVRLSHHRPDLTTSINNVLCYGQHLQLTAPYQTQSRLFDLQTYQTNFDQSTIDEINRFVSVKTNGLINQLPIQPQAPNQPPIDFILFNILYLKARWALPFEDYQFDVDFFEQLDGQITATHFIERLQDENGYRPAYYLKHEEFHALRLPLGYNDKLFFEIYLPYTPDGLPDFMEKFTEQQFWNGAANSKLALTFMLCCPSSTLIFKLISTI